jgi:chromosome partitioning protein
MYRQSVLDENKVTNIQPTEDLYCLATIKHYRSLIPMAQEHRKPIFHLTPADGAIGSHANAVQSAKKDFRNLAALIAEEIKLK